MGVELTVLGVMCEPPETKLVGLFKGFLFVLRVFRLTLFGSLVPFLH